MFQFPTFASLVLCIQTRMIESLLSGFPIQISSDHSSLPAPRGFSQAATSFFASYCLGIHHVRLISWPYNPKSFPIWVLSVLLKLNLSYTQCTSLSYNHIVKELCTLQSTKHKSISKSVSCLLFFLEPVGIEPTTPCLQSRCSPSWAMAPISLLLAPSVSGPGWTWTTDPTLIKRVL